LCILLGLMGIWLFISRAAQNPAADLNNDGQVNVTDLSILLSNWTKTGAGDINTDGTVNISDLSILLSSWGPVIGSTSGVPIKQAGWWWADIESVPVGTATCNSTVGNALKLQWDYFGQCGQEDSYGSPLVVSAAAQGIKPPPSGDTVVLWDKPLGDSKVWKKLNKTFTASNWTDGHLLSSTESRVTPRDISGRYISYMYIPLNGYSMTSHGWMLPFQFKENIKTQAGYKQDPTWGVGSNSWGTYGQYTFYLGGPNNGTGTGHNNQPKYDLRNYMDRWVKWEFRVYQGAKDTTGRGGRIEWWMDDKLMDTGYESEGHIGPLGFNSTYQGSPVTGQDGWVFAVGNYTSGQSLSGSCGCEPDWNYTRTKVYVDLTTLLPLP
jgi:hypothetical protein